MQELNQTPKDYKAFVDEENCIGCGKCIRVCPTDAIVGSKHVLHTILPALCTSCSNCVNACPTDCITLSTLGTALSEEEELRLTEQKQQRLNRSSMIVPPTIQFPHITPVKTRDDSSLGQRKQSIADAIARVKAKKNLTN